MADLSIHIDDHDELKIVDNPTPGAAFSQRRVNCDMGIHKVPITMAKYIMENQKVFLCPCGKYSLILNNRHEGKVEKVVN